MQNRPNTVIIRLLSLRLGHAEAELRPNVFRGCHFKRFVPAGSASDTRDPLCLKWRNVDHADHNVLAPTTRQDMTNRSIILDRGIRAEFLLTALPIVAILSMHRCRTN